MSAIVTIPENDRRERFEAAGGQTEFAFDFPVYQPTDIAVFRLRAGTETELAYGTDFTVTGAGDQGGGLVTLTTPATAGDIIAVRSDQPIARTTSFADGGDLPAAALNAEYNRVFIAFQQIRDALTRTMRVPETDPSGLILPEAQERADGLLGFNAAGDPVILQPDIGGDFTAAYLNLLLSTALNSALPRKVAFPYWGPEAEIPDGWQLCDGTNGTPDLRDRFIVAAGPTRPANSTGGADTVTSGQGGAHDHGTQTGQHALTVAQLPPHAHGLPGQQIFGNGAPVGSDVGAGPGTNNLFVSSTTSNAGSGEGHRHSITAAPNHTHSVAVVPRYFALAFIARTGFFTAPPEGSDVAELTAAALRRELHFALSDETTPLTTGNNRITIRPTEGGRILDVFFYVATASSSGNLTIDLNRAGASILSTKATILANQRTSKAGAVTPPVISSAVFAAFDEFTVDLDAAGTGAAGLKGVIVYEADA